VVRRGSAKAVCVGSIPTLASLPYCVCSKDLRNKGSKVDTKTDTKKSAPSVSVIMGLNTPHGRSDAITIRGHGLEKFLEALGKKMARASRTTEDPFCGARTKRLLRNRN
jgi:hypothetical protein